MFLRVYSTVILLWDFWNLVLTCVQAVMEAIFQCIKPPKEKSLKGEIALIAGAARGIGRAFAKELSSLGADVVLFDIDAHGVFDLAEEINENEEGVAYPYACDITNRQQVLQVSKTVRQQAGDVTIIIQCCGMPSPRLITEENSSDYLKVQKIMNVSVVSYFWILDAFLPKMLRNNHGHIVAMSSVAGISAFKDLRSVSASQFAVQGLLESLSQEVHSLGQHKGIYFTLAHIYPFVYAPKTSNGQMQVDDITSRLPSFFGIIDPEEAAKQVITGMRRNYCEISVPKYLLFWSAVIRLLPRKATLLIREFFDMGVDFA